MTEQEVDEALRRRSDVLLALPGVVGAARGRCDAQPCVKVYVATRSPELDRRIAEVLKGVPMEVEETGELKPLPRGGGG